MNKLGMGYWALGIGYWALGIEKILPELLNF